MFSLMATELLVILMLFLANGFFSGAEIAIISANRGRLRDQAERGDRRARLALDLAENPNRFLPTVQVGVTLVGTLAAAFGGATMTGLLKESIDGLGWRWMSAWSGHLALGLVVVILTFFSVLIGELIPKRIGMQNAAAVARFVAPSIAILGRVAHPLVWILGRATDVLAGLLGIRGAPVSGISLHEIRHLIELGTAEGLVDPVEQRLAFEALQLGDRTVKQIMKPRIDIDAVDVQTPPGELLGVIAMAGFSRLPVYEGDLDHIIGFVHLKDVLRQHYLGWTLDLRKLIRPALVVPDTMHLDQLLVRFQEQHNQLAVVVDEFGTTRGMVTLEDVLEELVGELLTEHHDRVEQMIVQREAGQWLVDGTVSIADLLERIGEPSLVPAAPRNVSSMAGLVLYAMGRIPAVGDQVDWQGLRLEVVDLDGRRIDKVLVTAMGSTPGRGA